MKYQTTERMRQCVNDAFDVHGGRAICDGPSNYLQSAYQMVTFAQGALRSHPYLFDEIHAAQDMDTELGQEKFERAFSSHIAFSVSNASGAFFHNLTGGHFGTQPEHVAGLAHWYRQLGRASRNFAFVADLAVVALGGGLKTKQKLTGRLADALSELFFVGCVLKRFEDDGKLSSGVCRGQWAIPLPRGNARFHRQFSRCAFTLVDASCGLPVRQAVSAGQ
jgi:acyl-CoA dehydrogenase